MYFVYTLVTSKFGKVGVNVERIVVSVESVKGSLRWQCWGTEGGIRGTTGRLDNWL